jgi:hypothetical protein
MKGLATTPAANHLFEVKIDSLAHLDDNQAIKF